MTNAPSASIFHIQLPALFATPAAESERCAAYVAATPNGISEGRYATPSADETHLPVRPSPDGVGKSTRVASPGEIFLSDEQPENMEDMSVADEVSRPERSIVSAAESPEKRPYRDPDALTPGAMRTEATSAP